jgi:hypothetical protein
VPEPLAGFDFSLEFSENLATRVLIAIFVDGAVPSSFNYDDPGQPGLITTRQTVGGKFVFENYLIDIEAGYELSLRDPVVRFQVGSTQLIEITMGFTFKLPRNVVTRIYDTSNPDTPLAEDPGTVKQNVDYPTAYRTAPATDPYPGRASSPLAGKITIDFPVGQKRFAAGRRASAFTAGVTRQAIVVVTLDDPFDARLKHFIETVVGKALTELIRREVDDYDMTPLLGDLSAFGLQVRDPVAIRLGATGSEHVLAVACNEFATVGNGDPLALSFFAGRSDFAVSFRESMFAQLIIALYQDGTIPDRYHSNGVPDPHGEILLVQPRIFFSNKGLALTFELRIDESDGETLIVTIQSIIAFEQVGVGELRVRLVSLQVDVNIEGLGALGLVNFVTFNLLAAFVGGILASILQKPISNSLDDGFEAFLASGRLAFSFNSPIRGTRRSLQVLPTAFTFIPGICTLRGAFTIA